MIKEIDFPPQKSDAYIWTDYVELRALVHLDQSCSRGELDAASKRRFDENSDSDEVEDRSPSKRRSDENSDSDDSDDSDEVEERSPRLSSLVERRWREVVNFHENRAIEFKGYYPFSISDDKDTIFVRKQLNVNHKAYIALLIASCLRNIHKSWHNEIAGKFEEICYDLFAGLMPSGSEVRATWARGGQMKVYKGKLYDQMTQLATDLRCTANFKERDFKKSDSGDGGIDMIAWHPMDDSREGLPISFAQCGCSRDQWRFKQLEASPSKHYRNLPTMHRWSTYYFLPLDLRDMDGDWANKSDIGEAIIVDRLRLLRLGKRFGLLHNIGSAPYVKEFCKIRTQ